MRSTPLYLAPIALALALAGCASVPAPDAPTVSIVNSLSFDHAMSGKRDGLRSAWPMERARGSTESFPMAQIKRCNDSGVCKWGVLKARRHFGAIRPTPDGVSVEVDVKVLVNRSQQVDGKDLKAGMTIPADVPALAMDQVAARTVLLPFGIVQRIEFEHGVRYELCALRLDAARQPLDKCDIAYF